MQTAFNTEKISKPLASHHHDTGIIIAPIYWLILVQKKRSNQLNDWILKKAATYSPTSAVPSAQTGLTSLFGKVRGEPRRYNHLSFMT